MRSVFLSILLTCLILLLAAAVSAQGLSVSVSVSKKSIGEEETVTLSVSLKGAGVERIRLPELFPPSFIVLDKSDKPNLSQDAFGRPVSGRVIRYRLQPTVPGRFRLGAFSLEFGGAEYRFQGENVEVVGSAPPPRKSRLPNAQPLPEVEIPSYPVDVRLSAEADKTKVFVGERILLSIRITHNSSEVADIKLIELPQFTGFWNKEIALARHVNQPQEIMINGKPYVTQAIPRFTLYPTKSGKLVIPPLTYGMQARGFGGGAKSLALKTPQISIESMPLPEAGKPAEFRGAVGRFKFKAVLKDRVTRVGAPARLALEIEAEGNIDALTPPPLPQIAGAKIYDFNRVELKSDDEKSLPTARWEADIVPQAAGLLAVPPIEFAYFDPEKRSYQVLKTDPLTLEVSAVDANPASTASSAGDSSPNIFSTIIASSAFRYSLLAVLSFIGLGAAAILHRKQKTEPAVSPPPAPNLFAQDIRRIVNSTYGKLHRGDEKAYAGDLLRAMRMIFENGFSMPASDLTADMMNELLQKRGADEQLCNRAAHLYKECEQICFAPAVNVSSFESNYARFNEARVLIFSLLELIEK